MMLSSLLYPRAMRPHEPIPSCEYLPSHDLLLLALNHFPTLELGKRTALFDPDDIAHCELVLLVVGVEFLRAPHRLLEHRMGVAALDTHDDGLVLLVAHHDALERALRHLEFLTSPWFRPGACAPRWS